MCGFLVCFNFEGELPDPGLFGQALELQRHRGPDDSRIRSFKTGTMGFNRLSIIDLSTAANQPLSYGPLTLVFNGEIYNYIELREELKKAGASFASSGDAEVLAAAIVAWGPEKAFRKARGMWAAVAYDQVTNQIIVSRDRVGIKPLWYARVGKNWAFSSEIKSLLRLFPSTRAGDPDVLRDYLSTAALDLRDRTFFSKIKSFPKGTYSVLRDGSELEPLPFWELEILTRGTYRPENLKAILEETIRQHLRSDVPIGLALSGGLDSTILAYFAHREAQMKFFSVVPPNSADESPLINETVRLWGLDHEYIPCSDAERPETVDCLIATLDQPFKAAQTLYQYAIRKAAADRGIKVFLTGDGADEVFGGYTKCLPYYMAGLIGSARFIEAALQARAFSWFAGLSLSRILYHGLREYLRKYPRSPSPLKTYLKKRLLEEPMPYWLRVEDGISMAVSLETRVPYLDHVLIEYAFSQEDADLMRDGKNKFMLRESMKEVLPKHVYEMPRKMQRPGSAKYLIFKALNEAAADAFASRGNEVVDGRINVDEYRKDQAEGRNAEFWLRAYLAARWHDLCLSRGHRLC